MKIRNAKESDIGAIAEIWLQMYRQHVKYDSGGYRVRTIAHATKKYKEQLGKAIRSRKKIVLVAVDGKVLGYINGRVEKGNGIYKPDRYASISQLAIDSKSRNKGVGTALLKDFTTLAKKQGAKQTRLSVDVRNTEAIALYERLGYRKLLYSMYKT